MRRDRYDGAVFEIGYSLREARMRRHIEFTDAEHGTKMRAKYLRALEDERFELLPRTPTSRASSAPTPMSSGMDGQLYVDEYNSRFVVGEEDSPVRAPGACRPRRHGAATAASRRSSLIALTAIALVTALVIAAWKFGEVDDRPSVG